MYSIREIHRVKTIEEAVELSKKKTSAVIGGGMWLRMGSRKITNAIDLSDLGYDTITEDADGFLVGAMVSLRKAEIHEGLHAYFQGAFKEAVKGIIGVQFRNTATIGGSIYARFGFSDIISLLLCLGAKIIVNAQTEIPIEEYITMANDRQIVTAVRIPKVGAKVRYFTVRKESVDLPVLNGGLAWLADQTLRLSLGARPKLSALAVLDAGTVKNLSEHLADEAVLEQEIEKILDQFEFGSNSKASKEYRRHLAKVYIKRSLYQLLGEEEEYAD